jgi:hypothetical protein
MLPSRRTAFGLVPAILLAVAAAPPATAQAPSPPAVKLFKVVTTRGDLIIGITPGDLTTLGTGPEVERIARRITQDGHFTAWRYDVTRAPDGSTRFGTRLRIAVMRQDSLTIEPYAPALPVAPPPAE